MVIKLVFIKYQHFKRQPHIMVKHTQTIRWQFAEELSVSGYFVRLSLKGLTKTEISLAK